MKKRIVALLLSAVLVALSLLSSCKEKPDGGTGGASSELGDDNTTFGDALEDSELYDGYFEEERDDITVTCLSGTADAYTISDGTLTFFGITEDSVYSLSGSFSGQIVVAVDDAYQLELELCGFSIVSKENNPILIESGDKVTLAAKKDTKNYIYDMRAAIDESDETLYSGAVHAMCDLDVEGKGELFVMSESNNGIHTKDDLKVKNLTLFVKCADNALKGNDSVTLESGTTTLIATVGDTVKTVNTDVSEKGNQRGTVTLLGGTHTMYAACDGIDAAYDVEIAEGVVLNIYTDKYSSYSEEVTAVSEDCYYIRFTSSAYKYSVKYYNSDSDYVFVDAVYHSTVSGTRSNYYYYAFEKLEEYGKMQFFIYSEDMEQSNDEEYLVASDYLTPSESYDTFALTNSYNGLYYSWTNYTTTVNDGMGGGMGGMNDGNTEKGDHSTKGIKSGNEIRITGGTVTVKSYDDAIHANADSTLENGSTPTGNVTVSGGTLLLYSNDDGLHADGKLLIEGGSVTVSHSYEGVEGVNVSITGGSVSVVANDDGINATATTGTSIEIAGGSVYIFCCGDGIDSNSRTSYAGILFSGGTTVVISTSSGNSAIDTEAGYAYTGGKVLALMPSGGMTSEATHAQNFSSIATSTSVSLSSGSYLTVTDGEIVCVVKMSTSMSARAIYLGSSSASVSSKNSTDKTLDENGVFFKKD